MKTITKPTIPDPRKEEPQKERALVAVGLDGMQILVARGSGIECDIQEGGLRNNADIGLEEPDTPGIYVIEFVTRWRPGNWEYPNDGDTCREEQIIRQPTENEWSALQSGLEVLYEMWSDIESWAQYCNRKDIEKLEKGKINEHNLPTKVRSW